MSKGQIQNTAGDFSDERFWAHFADLSMHEEMFNAGTILYNVFPNKFYDPVGAAFSLEVTALTTDAMQFLLKATDETFLVRLLADGMSGASILHRLFDEQLAGQSFPEASSIVWRANVTDQTDDRVTIDVVSSHHWLEELFHAEQFESTAYADAIADK